MHIMRACASVHDLRCRLEDENEAETEGGKVGDFALEEGDGLYKEAKISENRAFSSSIKELASEVPVANIKTKLRYIYPS